jgi:hypothetical protein
MKDFDKDGDGFIAGSELDATPGIKAAMATIDADKDGKVTADEIAQRIKAWQATRYGIMSLAFAFTLDGRPLTDGDVTFEPEPFLADAIKVGVGNTGPGGGTTISIPKDQRPAKDTPVGLQLGLYRVRVSKKVNGQETIPAKYNADTTLGQQVSMDDPAVSGHRLRFDLKSK